MLGVPRWAERREVEGKEAGVRGIDGLYMEVVGDGVPTLVLHGGLGVDHTVYRSFDELADVL